MIKNKELESVTRELDLGRLLKRSVSIVGVVDGSSKVSSGRTGDVPTSRPHSRSRCFRTGVEAQRTLGLGFEDRGTGGTVCEKS